MGPLGFLPTRHGQYHMKGRDSFRPHASLTRSPGFPGIAHDLEKCLVLVVIVMKNLLRLGEEQRIPLRGQPFQIGQAFLERVPVVAEIIGEIEYAGELREEFRRCTTPVAPQHFQNESLWHP